MIRPLDSQSEGSDSFDPSPYINDLFTCTIRRLKAADIDQEVKERAISCMGQIICNLGNRRLWSCDAGFLFGGLVRVSCSCLDV